MANSSHGPHTNPVWSTFIFVLLMLVFLFYLETMIKPMDFLVTKSFVLQSNIKHAYPRPNSSVLEKYSNAPVESRDLNSKDNVLVFMHIQKTAGKAFNKHIALDLHPDSGPGCHCNEEGDTMEDLLPGSCVCDLEDEGKSSWLFSRLTVGWPCGVHAGLSDLSISCMDKELNHRQHATIARRYFITTVLREPLTRYVSEWKQVTSHGQWPIRKLFCHPLVDKSYFNGNWTDVSLDEFLDCPDNPSNNRQVRMLADLKRIGCHEVNQILKTSKSTDNLNNTLLHSAKTITQELPFFGLYEYPLETDLLFEHTFGVKFSRHFTSSASQPVKVTTQQHHKMEAANKLDIELYRFAKTIFFDRLKKLPSIGHNANINGSVYSLYGL